MTVDEMIDVLQGFKDGRSVEYKRCGFSLWEIAGCPVFNFFNYDYRLAPEPKIVPYGPKDGGWLVLRKFKVKDTGACGFITTAKDRVSLSTYPFNHEGVAWEELLDNYLDVTNNPAGIPFGREEK